jgi:hypothetical protein
MVKAVCEYVKEKFGSYHNLTSICEKSKNTNQIEEYDINTFINENDVLSCKATLEFEFRKELQTYHRVHRWVSITRVPSDSPFYLSNHTARHTKSLHGNCKDSCSSNEIEGFSGKEVNDYDVYDRCVNSQKCCLPAPTNCERDVFHGSKEKNKGPYPLFYQSAGRCTTKRVCEKTGFLSEKLLSVRPVDKECHATQVCCIEQNCLSKKYSEHKCLDINKVHINKCKQFKTGHCIGEKNIQCCIEYENETEVK